MNIKVFLNDFICLCSSLRAFWCWASIVLVLSWRHVIAVISQFVNLEECAFSALVHFYTLKLEESHSDWPLYCCPVLPKPTLWFRLTYQLYYKAVFTDDIGLKPDDSSESTTFVLWVRVHRCVTLGTFSSWYPPFYVKTPHWWNYSAFL